MTSRGALRGAGRLAVVACLCCGLMGAAALAQDPAVVAPKAIKVKFENERVRVLEDISTPGDKEPMHSHPANVVYVITGGKVRFTFPDGKTAVAEIKDGDTLYREAVTHAAENIGTTTVHLIIVELKK
jgi:quercetin dioxygenase-like cupin family protein